MTSKVLPVLYWTPTISVPENETEYNSLAPKRANAQNEDAVASTCYRSVSPVIRDGIATYFDADAPAGLGIKRKNFGTEDEPQLEKEGVFVKRAVAELMASRGETEAQVVASLAAKVQEIADSPDAKFDPSLREGTGAGPAIGKNDLKLAAAVIADGRATEIAGKLSAILGVTVATDEKSLARAIADNRRALAAKAAAEQKAALGL